MEGGCCAHWVRGLWGEGLGLTLTPQVRVVWGEGAAGVGPGPGSHASSSPRSVGSSGPFEKVVSTLLSKLLL